MEQFNTMNIPRDKIHEEILSFSGSVKIELKPQQTVTLNAQAVLTTGQEEPDQEQSRALLLADLGWGPLDAARTRARLAAFEEDWNAPGMEEYDNL